MSELRNRAAHEEALAAAVGAIGLELLDELMQLLGDPPDITNVPDTFWETVSTKYSDAVLPELESAFLDMVKQNVTDYGVDIGWDVINQRAADWAKTYTYDMVSGITQNRRIALQEAISSFYEKQWTLGELRAALNNEYGPVRAEMIAITETTRAAVEGDRAYVDELRKRGAKLGGKVQTNKDERVCRICGPKQDLDPLEVGFPPYHVGCRCWAVWEAL